MDIVRRVVVFDAANLAAESAFWAGMLRGRVLEDERWHSVFDADGRWVIGVQLAPEHVPPVWPDGIPQQVHLDLHIDPATETLAEAAARAIALGGRQRSAEDGLIGFRHHQRHRILPGGGVTTAGRDAP